jgi:glycosyltransferase involved in cell wall biosynthesis
MIVKDEADIIGRCLDSVLPLVDCAVLVDTGSTDGTQAIIRAKLDEYDVPGYVHSRPWVDFAHNRNEALEMLAPFALDYALMIDADEELVTSGPLVLGLDCYDIETRLDGLRYNRVQLFRNRPGFKWRGILHEYLELPEGATRGPLANAYVRSHRDGARGKNPAKYYDDACTLAGAYDAETDPALKARYLFYMAQSYRDAHVIDSAISAYERRAVLGGWSEEVYISILNVARLKEQYRPGSNAEILGAYMLAIKHSPKRLEAFHDAARFARKIEHFEIAVLLASACHLTPPAGALFVEKWIYDYGLKDEFAVASYWAGFPGVCEVVCRQILDRTGLPPEVRERVQRNLELSQQNGG